MKKVIITEKQYDLISKNLISEAVGVPEFIMDSAEKLYDIVSAFLKKIDKKQDEYKLKTNVNLPIGDEVLRTLKLSVHTEELAGYKGKVEIASMGVSNAFKFDRGILMQINETSSEIELNVNFVTSSEWEPKDLYDRFVRDEVNTISVMAHELKHRFDRLKKKVELVGGTADYQAYSKGMSFGIPVIEEFMRNSYFIQNAENLVRPTEIATRMIKKGITRDEFYEFITNDIVYVELKEIKNFSFEHLISGLKSQMGRCDELLKFVGLKPKTMSIEKKIEEVLRIVYVNIVNAKMEAFDNYFFDHYDMMVQQMGPLVKMFMEQAPNQEEKEKIRDKYIRYVIKYEGREIDFFKDECEKFNYIATKVMKKISKVYSLLPEEDKTQTNESILDWDLHQKMMEKKYGKRPIETSYNFKK